MGNFAKAWRPFTVVCLLGLMLPVWQTVARAAPQKAGGAALDLATSTSISTDDLLITLVNLNPHINRWYVLELKSRSRDEVSRFHLDSINPRQTLSLSPRGIVISDGTSKEANRHCLLWANRQHHIQNLPLATYPNPYFPLCEGLLYLRLPRSSNTKLSMTEWATEALRRTDFGEGVINMVKPMLVKWEAEAAKASKGKTAANRSFRADAPLGAKVRTQSGGVPAIARKQTQLGISLVGDPANLEYGQWHAARLRPGVHVSLVTPGSIEETASAQHDPRLFPLPPQEADKLVYMIAYDLGLYSLSYRVGTVDPPIVNAPALYGAATSHRQALVPIGSIPPFELAEGIGVFVGGFKQRHAIIRSGPHQGKAYGYIENGVELAPMAAGLASLYSDSAGQTELIAWPDDKTAELSLRQRVVSARQNGVMILEGGEVGSLVRYWREGNWSADAHGVRRSLRSGVCIQGLEGERRHLIFMAFTSATPSTMARVMRAYHCQNAMHLDMNAHMYLHNALYLNHERDKMQVEYLHADMLYPRDLKHHRFIMDNNSRDFFYVRFRTPAASLAERAEQGHGKNSPPARQPTGRKQRKGPFSWLRFW